MTRLRCLDCDHMGTCELYRQRSKFIAGDDWQEYQEKIDSCFDFKPFKGGIMKDHHRMRAWDGERYWIMNDKGIFISEHGSEALHSIIAMGMIIELCSGEKQAGKLIYEGDILKNNEDETGEITFDGGRYILKGWVDHDLSYWLASDLEFELVGNINENPELLND